MHGVTNPITLEAELGDTETDAVGVDRIGVEVTGELSRGDHGMKFNQVPGSGNLAVSDKIRLDLDVCAIEQA
jgi:polyisoprenoid-binding protein YceI